MFLPCGGQLFQDFLNVTSACRSASWENAFLCHETFVYYKSCIVGILHGEISIVDFREKSNSAFGVNRS